ncbi:MAG: CPBP family glutamic-type intramembrane protease [Promethearchaeota archaeon]
MFFRGLLHEIKIFSRLRKAVFSSTIFSLYHVLITFNFFTYFYYFFYYFVFGMILELELKICDDQLLFSIITHGLFNFIVFSI